MSKKQEFGHSGIIASGVCIDSWGAGPFVISAGGKSYRFEDSDRFGPHLVKLNGDVRENPYPPERSPFWIAHRIWVRQGRRLQEDKITCIYDQPKPTKVRLMGRSRGLAIEGGQVRRIGRYDYLVIEAGEEDGEIIVVD